MAERKSMIRNFALIKAQLRELAEVINAFKSETVQLRLIELVFEEAKEDRIMEKAKMRRAGRRKAIKRSAPPDAVSPKGKGSRP
jgi:molybdenum cofactor biosynthesis enzyme MoaA